MASPLLTDRYELTMIDAAARRHRVRPCVFELFRRRRVRAASASWRARAASCSLRDFRFGDDELRYLRDTGSSAQTISFLEDYRFTGTIRGYREGELYFPGRRSSPWRAFAGRSSSRPSPSAS
jgi:nicotinate phosphoribosyltransferase